MNVLMCFCITISKFKLRLLILKINDCILLFKFYKTGSI